MRALPFVALAWSATGLAVAQTAGPDTSSESSWELKTSTSALTDHPGCILTPKQRSRIQIDRYRLIVSGLPKNSIFNFQYRIDEEVASGPMRPSAAMQDAGAVYLDGAVFDAIMGGKRFRIRILDKWHEAITEDVDLTGLDEMHKKMIEECK